MPPSPPHPSSPLAAAISGASPPPGIALRPATGDDLPALAALREAVGWSVHRWAIRDLMASKQGLLLVAEMDGAVVASGSGIAYGSFGVVGNMVVAAEHRRRGLGRILLDGVLAFLDAAGVRQVDLYATRDGRPLYRAAGFASAGTNLAARIERGAVGPAPPGVDVRQAGTADLAELAAYDRPRFGGDRSELLLAALSDVERRVFVARRGDALVGWAMLPPEPDRIGPWLADTTDIAHALLASAFSHTGEPALRTGLPIENDRGAAWLRGLGAETHRWDGRMRLGSGTRQAYHHIFGIMVGALG